MNFVTSCGDDRTVVCLVVVGSSISSHTAHTHTHYNTKTAFNLTYKIRRLRIPHAHTHTRFSLEALTAHWLKSIKLPCFRPLPATFPPNQKLSSRVRTEDSSKDWRRSQTPLPHERPNHPPHKCKHSKKLLFWFYNAVTAKQIGNTTEDKPIRTTHTQLTIQIRFLWYSKLLILLLCCNRLHDPNLIASTIRVNRILLLQNSNTASVFLVDT